MQNIEYRGHVTLNPTHHDSVIAEHKSRDITNNCFEDCEGSFSKSPCQRCLSPLGGERHPAMWWEGRTGYPIEVCVDCLVDIS